MNPEQMSDEELERADAIESGDEAKVYAVGRKHERDDVLRELRRWKALTGNRKVDEIIARIEKGKHAAAGARRAEREQREAQLARFAEQLAP